MFYNSINFNNHRLTVWYGFMDQYYIRKLSVHWHICVPRNVTHCVTHDTAVLDSGEQRQ